MRQVVGKTAWSKYLGVTLSWSDALKAARDLSLQCDATVARLKRLSPDERNEIAAGGGLQKLKHLQAFDKQLIAGLKAMGESPTSGPAFEGVSEEIPMPEELEEDWEFTRFKLVKSANAIESETLSRARLLGSAEFEGRGLQSLVDLSEKTKPQGTKSLDRSRLYVRRLTTFLGADCDPADISQQDAARWRDHMSETGVSGVNQSQHLAKLSALYAVAISEGRLATNPFAGIKARFTKDEKKLSKKKRAFGDEELRSFLIASEKKGEPFHTIIRCLAVTGARSSEICGLRVCDLRWHQGNCYLDINDEVRDLKNAASRRLIPLPGSFSNVLRGLADGRDGTEPLFPGLPRRQQGPAHQLQIEASKIIREHVSKDPRVTLHSLRHTWRQRAESLGISPAVRRAILGHALGKDVHDTAYGDRPQFNLLVDAVEKVAQSYGLAD
ncbi:tyrosine-type recombinase/integrase [Hyphomicrobium sp. MC1]|uniref:tyrosine-type recombinase/integrase n=1 Tax=Hyphomicrobium sp. (strain MC1) TaxID=717785 RepID=UPI0012F4A427|nr:tyrosine-type recombinase/integrase [Hyphomicrobium sp. MC1]